MSTPGIPSFIEERASAQKERPGIIKVPDQWYDEFCRENPAWFIHGWSGISFRKRRDRAQCAFSPFTLKADVLDKISKLNQEGIKRLLNLVMGFQDNFMFSDPERFPSLIYSDAYRRFMRWVISMDVYRPGETTKQWKAFIVLVKWKAVRSRTSFPPIPTSFPGIPRHLKCPEEMPFPDLWRALCPWLGPIWEKGLENKCQCTRLAHLLTSRNLPSGTKSDRMRTLEEHAATLCDLPPKPNPQRALLLKELAYQTGARIRVESGVSLKDAHTSMTNSASIDSPVNSGGRARLVSERFRVWLSEVQPHDKHEETWFGRPYWLKAGVPRWMTICRDSIADEGRPGDSAFITDVDFTPGKYRYEDPLYCLDKYTGYQLLQWAIEEGIRNGSIIGSPFRDENGLKMGRFPSIRASAIGEPGGKSRVVTVGEDWLTIFLQPLAHALLANLKKDKSARAGLSRAWQGFEYVKAWSTKDKAFPPSVDERFILTSDLKTATDYCIMEYSKSLLTGFILGLGLEGALSSLWIELLVGPRIYEGPVEEYISRTTQRGVLMGDPGSKVVLSLFNKVAEMEAILRYHLEYPRRPSNSFLLRKAREGKCANTRFRLFAFAGDDHIAVGPERYLLEITRSHIRNGMSVSESSNFISELAGFYCEELIFIGNPQVWKCWGEKVPLARQAYEDNPHVDALKIRLFSLCVKEHEGKNETNPAIGMAASLRGMIAWFAEGWETLRPLCTKRFFQRMRKLIPENLFLRGLPRSLGGIEAPVFGVSSEVLKASWDELPVPIRRAICLVRKENTGEVQALRRILSKVSSATCARGIDLSSIEEEVRAVLSTELCLAKPVDELRPSFIDELTWANMRLTDKLKTVEHQGEYIPVGEALQVVMRPYIFRDLLFPEESIAHGIDPFRKRAFRQMSWYNRINRLLEAITETVGKSSEIRERYLKVDEAYMAEVRDEIISSFDLPYLASAPKEIILIPKEVVYTDKLCTLRLQNIAIPP
nr:RNA-dependent RNA polymerase [Narnavirus sp.]